MRPVSEVIPDFRFFRQCRGGVEMPAKSSTESTYKPMTIEEHGKSSAKRPTSSNTGRWITTGWP